MKRYEVETGEMATFIYTWIDKEGEEHSDSPDWVMEELEKIEKALCKEGKE